MSEKNDASWVHGVLRLSGVGGDEMSDGDTPPEVQALVEALRSLAGDVAANVAAFDDEMRQAIGNINYNVLLHHLRKGVAALTAWENRA